MKWRQLTYAELDAYIREGIEPKGKCNNSDELKIDKIKRMYVNNKFKTEIIQIPRFEPDVYIIPDADVIDLMID